MNKPNQKPIARQNAGAAIRAQRRTHDDANRIVEQHVEASQKPAKPTTARKASVVTNTAHKLKVTFLGGLEDVGEKNMAIIEYGNEAIILDCGINLSVDLPGVNYAINDTAYLTTIRHKIKAYVITHGHLDHIGGLKHTVPKFPAPIYGSRYTIGVIEKAFEDQVPHDIQTKLDLKNPTTHDNFKPTFVTANIDNHEQLKIGSFMVEFIRITHSLPDASAICITTPVGRIIATGDFRLDPEPLDKMPSDTKRIEQLGDEGVLLLLSDSSYADVEGRVPTESSLQQSFYDIIDHAEGRIFVAAFSSNMNRAQMIINAAVASGRQVALDGRGMLNYAEIAVRQGILKVPKGTIIPITQASNLAASKLLVMCTGGQGEPNASLQRMSQGEHKHIKLQPGDTVIISSSPIPGNEVSYDAISNRLSQTGVHLFRHPTHEVDGCGPLHVSGHARRDELREMLQLVQPTFFIPVHGGRLRRTYHAELGVQQGLPRAHCLTPDNGDSFYLTASTIEYAGIVPFGSVLVDQNGLAVSGIVVKDRLMLAEDGIITVIVTVDKKTGKLLTSPDIVSRGFIALRDNQEFMGHLRQELHRSVQQRFTRVDPERFKGELRDHVLQLVHSQTGRVPMVIAIVNVLDSAVQSKQKTPVLPATKNGAAIITAHAISQPPEHQRFQEMRKRLLQH